MSNKNNAQNNNIMYKTKTSNGNNKIQDQSGNYQTQYRTQYNRSSSSTNLKNQNSADDDVPTKPTTRTSSSETGMASNVYTAYSSPSSSSSSTTSGVTAKFLSPRSTNVVKNNQNMVKYQQIQQQQKQYQQQQQTSDTKVDSHLLDHGYGVRTHFPYSDTDNNNSSSGSNQTGAYKVQQKNGDPTITNYYKVRFCQLLHCS